ncbi:MAG: hypothetical protein ACXIUD_04815 [Mongoliitalea sp.]
MSKERVSLMLIVAVFFVCSCAKKENDTITYSNDWELVILDSIQVDYLGTIGGADYRNGQAVIFNYKENKLIAFDSTGRILYENSFPYEGPGSLYYPSKLRLTDGGGLFSASFIGWLYELNPDLTLKQEIKLPFPTEAKDGGGFFRTLEYWNKHLISFYPGRDGANPYDPHFFRDHYLLEKINPETREATPIIKIPSISRYASDKFYERPWLQFGIQGNILELVLSNETFIHKYDLNNGGEYMSSIDFMPSKFLDNGEHSQKYQYISGTRMLDGHIKQFFVTEKGSVLIYTEGIEEDVFLQNELNIPKNFPLYKQFQRQILRLVFPNDSFSNEIVVPYRVGKILNIESVEKPFYALRDDDFIGEEQDFLTFYKLQLRRRDV